jgi:hypothetical protein
MECRLAGEIEVLGENLPQRHFCPSQNPTCLGPVRTPDRSGGKPATNRLSYGAAKASVSPGSVQQTMHFFWLYSLERQSSHLNGRMHDRRQVLASYTFLLKWQVALIIQPWHGPHREHCFQQLFHCCGHYLATAVVYRAIT